MKCNGYDKFKQGSFNDSSQKVIAPDVTLVTLTGRAYPTKYSFKVKDIGTPAEEVIEIVSGD